MTSTRVGDQYRGEEFYCDVAIPNAADLQIEHDDEWVLAFHHTKPFWNNHIVVVPKKHIGSLTTATAEDEEWLRRLFVVVQTLARKLEQRDGAASVTTNLGQYQDSKHLHVHIHNGGGRVDER
ncbi:HIT domain-containing protein [Promicromonospora sp. Populi]|uniref:HIT domain-containing protein n=1 Tax=Promicromonospora sp. Populi TaxID=3239420 RepID=UPI0034E1D0BB